MTLTTGQKVTGRNFGVTTAVLISGSVFNDANGDKLRNSGETELSGWRVFVDKDKDGIFDAGENGTFAVTLSSGGSATGKLFGEKR